MMGIFGNKRFSAMHNTPLSPEEQKKFDEWAGQRRDDLEDYDLQGFWKSGEAFAENGHGSDKWKKPNHPTFSDESIYSAPGTLGGQWSDAGGDRWNFWASDENMKHRTIGDLVDYFNKREQGNNVIFPFDWRLPKGGRNER